MTEKEANGETNNTMGEALGIYLHQIVSTLLRGAVAVTQADPRVVMLALARIVGQVIGSHFGGNGTAEGDEAVRSFREACSTQFSVGINQAPIPRIQAPTAAEPARDDQRARPPAAA